MAPPHGWLHAYRLRSATDDDYDDNDDDDDDADGYIHEQNNGRTNYVIRPTMVYTNRVMSQFKFILI